MAVAVKDLPDLRRMAFDLEVEENWPPVAVETLWVECVHGVGFRVDSIPFFVQGIAIDDFVEGRAGGAGEPDSLLHFSRKVSWGGHSTIQVIMDRDEVTSAVKAELAEAGCRTEGSPWHSLFGVDIPESGLISVVHGLLDRRVALGHLEYQDSCIA